MERTEPALVPEWLRSTGTVTGGGNSAHHFVSSSHSDVSSLGHHGRNRNSRIINDFDSARSAFLDRASSLNSRRSPSNGSAKHAYSSFSRSHRDKDRDKDRERDKERLSFAHQWDGDSSDPLESLTSRVEKLGGISASRAEKDTLRRSHSVVTRKPGEPLPRRIALDSRDSVNSNHYNGNGLHSGGTVGSKIQKAVFEKDFPSLGNEERQGAPEIARVSSPGLSSASLSLPVGNSALIGGEGWTSALADVPSAVGSSSTGCLPGPHTVSTSGSGAASTASGLNMAEALVQAPARTRAAPQLSVNTQRLEELAIKQSRQLIPVTPSMPKGSVLNLSDKSKAKSIVRTSEISVAVKSGQQQTSLIPHGNQSPRSGHAKSDLPKTSGKLLVLKPGWENGVSSPTQKDTSSPTTNVNSRVVTNQHTVAPITSAPARNSNNPKISAGERKASFNPIAGFTVEKKPSLAKTQSRNDFFNLLKKKTSTNSSAGISDSDPHNLSSSMDKSEASKEKVNASVIDHAHDNGTAASSNGDTLQEAQRFYNDEENMVYPDEEEAAFLRSLGWDEEYGEDEGLTEEEINSFLQQVMKQRPSLKLCRGLQP